MGYSPSHWVAGLAPSSFVRLEEYNLDLLLRTQLACLRNAFAYVRSRHLNCANRPCQRNLFERRFRFNGIRKASPRTDEVEVESRRLRPRREKRGKAVKLPAGRRKSAAVSTDTMYFFVSNRTSGAASEVVGSSTSNNKQESILVSSFGPSVVMMEDYSWLGEHSCLTSFQLPQSLRRWQGYQNKLHGAAREAAWTAGRSLSL